MSAPNIPEANSKSQFFRLSVQRGTPVTPVNNPALAGQKAGPITHVGRFMVFPVHTRFEAICWFAADASQPIPGGFEIVRQLPTFEQVIDSLPKE